MYNFLFLTIMSNRLLVPNGYKTRLFDQKVEKYLSGVFVAPLTSLKN